MSSAGSGLLTVDLAGLERLAGRLAAVGEELSAAGAGFPAVAGLPDPLASAVDDFRESWLRSLQRTGEAAQTAGRQLASAGVAYRRVESAIVGCPA